MRDVGLFLHDTMTGDFIGNMSHLIAGGTGTDQINSFGDATVHLSGFVKNRPGQWTPKQAWAALQGNAVTFTIATVNAFGAPVTVVGAYVLLTKHWRDATGQIEIYGEQIRTLMQHRLTFGVFNFADGDFTLTNVSRATAARAILERATAWGGWWGLPLTLPAPGGAGGFSVDVSRFDAQSIDALLTQLEKTGTEVRFQPVIGAGLSLSYTVEVAPKLTGPVTAISSTAAKSPIVDYETSEDATRQVSGTFVTGNGMGSARPYAGAGGMAGPTIPVRDSYRAASDIDSVAVLQQVADAALAADRFPRVSVAFQVVPSTAFPLEQFLPKRRLQIDRIMHPVLPDSSETYRVLKLHFDLASDKVTPVLERVG